MSDLTYTELPLCNDCWANLDQGDPARIPEPHEEECGVCGFPTRSGIYVYVPVEDEDE